jgi:hypothetical protein
VTAGSAGSDDDAAIRALLTRLARPHASGGQVIERATLLAEGADFPAIIDWIANHAGTPEASDTTAAKTGLHGARMSTATVTEPAKPARYVLPAGTLA